MASSSPYLILEVLVMEEHILEWGRWIRHYNVSINDVFAIYSITKY